ncbi:hypothetical protein [Lysinibacillus sp. NPDC056232]|uniref:hypothetical protein n=1 Tax=Lysinibacillus sp. NPDC056232 TaxID=3345756 RepID=UPI0035DE4A61
MKNYTQAAHRTPLGSFALCESVATATIVLSVRKRSDSNNKALSRNGNQPLILPKSPTLIDLFIFIDITDQAVIRLGNDHCP